ncbi:ABC transporter ATP-binding protein [Acuticoccus kandeliae]|uniref:ABC transporter ATP-binding protein n=1 Tax=Acuticoccus kandeliae TaxID=2073160 RepID=UPI000D3E9342|nr:oligopeptide/dipeptide ABC transporter ATP-binding protein [Acuticoccus kandeliae]
MNAIDPNPVEPALLAVDTLTKSFPSPGGLFAPGAGTVKAVAGVSFTIGRGEVLGLVGESGSGKTTVGQSVLRLIEPSAGRVTFDGVDVTAAGAAEMRALRRRMQMVFQDPFASLNPRMRIYDTIAEPLEIHHLADSRAERRERVAELLALVGLHPDHAKRYPHEFSGGQRQRIGIARALATEPDFVVADELVSALDVSIQAQILALIERLQGQLGLAMLLVAHDLAVVQYLARRVAVMYLGTIVEIGPTEAVYAAPAHPYTRALLSAIPSAEPERRRQRVILEGDMPSPLNPPSGCRFRTRCPFALPRCAEEEPVLRDVGGRHQKACLRDDI